MASDTTDQSTSPNPPAPSGTAIPVQKAPPAAPATIVPVAQTSTISPVPETPAIPTPPPTPQKKKILYVVTKPSYGGAQRYVHDLATHAPAEYEPVVLCGPASGYPREGLLISKLEEAGVRVVILPALTRDIGISDVKALYQMYKAIRAETPTILHLNSSKAGAIGVLVGRILRVPKIIFTSHGWAFNEDRPQYIKALIWLVSVATILLSHKVICVSGFDRKAFAGWFFESKLLTIHNALSPIEYLEREEARADLVPHCGIYEGDFWIGTVAELTRNKNIWLAISAVQKARDAGLRIFYCIVGDGEERFDLEDKVKELKLDQNIRFLGFVSEAEKFLKAFDAILLTSKKEGLPYIALEAVRAHVPIIASQVGGVEEIVRDGENGILCQSGNIDQFTDAIIRISRDEELRAKLSLHEEGPDRFEQMLRETYISYL